MAQKPNEKLKPESARRVGQPTTQVAAKPTRRRFTAAYKRSVLKQADACSKPGEISALLRREGLYSSHRHTWKRARDHAELAALEPKKRGRKPKKLDPRDRRIADLEKLLANERVARRRADALVDIQKKLTTMFGALAEDANR